MLTSLRTRLQKDEDGFTLIELMVVVLIIAILIAIAIPTFLGAQDRARDRGAQSDLRNALTAAKTLATDNAGLLLDADGGVLDADDMELAEPSLAYSDTAASTDDILVVDGGATGLNVVLVTESESGTAFCIAANSDGEVFYDSGAAADISTFATCNSTEW